VNGIIHLVLSIFTLSYSPGVISGVILFLPLGTSIYLRILPKLEKKEKIAAISIGLLLLFSVSMIAMNI
jgi:glycopeptide antibiotics resistance protein